MVAMISQLAMLAVAVVGVGVALAQIRSARRESQSSRQAALAWQLYEAYSEPRMRDAEGAVLAIKLSDRLPMSGTEYGEQYADKVYGIPESETISSDTYTYMRRLLRFYNLSGILLEKKLVDEDILHSFVGPGLDNLWPAITVALDWCHDCVKGSMRRKALGKQAAYTYVSTLHDRYLNWEYQATRKRSGPPDGNNG